MSRPADQKDFVAAGFHKLDDTAVELRPPKIRWGELYRRKNADERLAYAEKLASTMNAAAAQIQRERDELNALCEKKEKQIEALKHAMEQNSVMLQSEVQRLNEDRQGFLKAIADLKNRLRAHGDYC